MGIGITRANCFRCRKRRGRCMRSVVYSPKPISHGEQRWEMGDMKHRRESGEFTVKKVAMKKVAMLGGIRRD